MLSGDVGAFAIPTSQQPTSNAFLSPRPDRPMMETADFRWTRRDWHAYVLYLSPRRTTGWWILVAIIELLLLAAAAFAVARFRSGKMDLPWAAFAILMPVLFPFLMFGQPHTLARRLARRRTASDGLRVRIGEPGLIVTAPGTRREIAWSRIVALERVPGLLVFHGLNGPKEPELVVPDSAFPEADADTFLAEAAASGVRQRTHPSSPRSTWHKPRGPKDEIERVARSAR